MALGRVFLFVRCNIIKASWEAKTEKLSYRKKYIKEFVSVTSPIWLHTALPMSFVIFAAFSTYSLPFVYWVKKMLCSKTFLAPENGVYGLQPPVSTALQKPEFMLVQVKNNNKKLKKRFIAIFFKFVHAYFSYWVMEILSITNDVLKKIFSK